MLSTVGFAVGTAPWAQAIDNVAQSAQGSSAVPARTISPAGPARRAGGPAAASVSAVAGVSAVAALADRIPVRHQAGAAVEVIAREPAKQAPRHQATTRQAAKHQAAKSKAVRHQAAKPKARAASAKPFLIYDSVTPGAIPSGKAAAVYANGAYAASSAQLTRHHSVLWIDTNGSDPAANVLDVEPGDATPAGAAHWVEHRLSAQPHSVAIVYTMKSDWQQVKANVAALPSWMRPKVRYWIADPTGVPHVVAGASATQWYWGSSYDVTTANPDFTG